MPEVLVRAQKKKKGACDAAAQVVIGVLQRTQIRTTLLTRDSEPSRIARIEFKKQKKLYGYRVAAQGICT